ncbi:hypothetical protein [Sporosarcina sp. USHLN248]|uniref:hypothetical protein n=1 Tax=Sporosarcina sp. USHLN248 TaxID=3081300 RepID=UPI00301B5A44
MQYHTIEAANVTLKLLLMVYCTEKCELELFNHSSDTVTFQLNFLDSPFVEVGSQVESLMNLNGPYTITIEGKRTRTVKLQELIDVSDVFRPINNAYSRNIHITIADGAKTRIL